VRTRFAGVPGTSLLSPDPDQPFAGVPRLASQIETTSVSVGAYVLDTLKLSEEWEVSGGVRYDRFDTKFSQSIAPASAFDRVDAMPSYRASIVYKPLPNGSVYFGYGTSFNPSAESLSLSAANANLAPEKNRSFEVGSKWDLFDGQLGLRAAVFRLEKTNARVPDPSDPTLNTLGGDQQVDGFDIGATGRITERWQISGGYTYLDGKVVKSSPTPTSPAPGAPLTNTPKHTLTLFSTYEVTQRFEVGGGINYVSSRVARNTGATLFTVPGYWTVDLLGKYQITENVDFQVNVYNLFDEAYFDQLHPSHVVPGMGRAALFTVAFKF
jgi:catecholate siderophore receptor